MRSTCRVFAFFVAFACCCSSYGQLLATISLDTTSEPDGRTRYDYLIQNLLGSEFTINTFVLDVGDDADLEDLQGPPGWFGDFDPLEDPFELVFVSLDAASEIPVGGSGNFSFTSPLLPGPIDFYLANLTPTGDELGAIFDSIEGPFIAPGGIAGDYNGNGQVEQADLDLVLLNWGLTADPPPNGWINDLPSGQIDQDELDGVLLNWGSMAAQLTGAAVPEPSAASLALAAAGLFLLINRRK